MIGLPIKFPRIFYFNSRDFIQSTSFHTDFVKYVFSSPFHEPGNKNSKEEREHLNFLLGPYLIIVHLKR